VRAKFDAVEIPLNRMKKSRNVRNKSFLFVFLIEGSSSLGAKTRTTFVGDATKTTGCTILLRERRAYNFRPESEPRRPLILALRERRKFLGTR
jgi:hypothetical protein